MATKCGGKPRLQRSAVFIVKMPQSQPLYCVGPLPIWICCWVKSNCCGVRPCLANSEAFRWATFISQRTTAAASVPGLLWKLSYQ